MGTLTSDQRIALSHTYASNAGMLRGMIKSDVLTTVSKADDWLASSYGSFKESLAAKSKEALTDDQVRLLLIVAASTRYEKGL